MKPAIRLTLTPLQIVTADEWLRKQIKQTLTEGQRMKQRRKAGKKRAANPDSRLKGRLGK